MSCITLKVILFFLDQEVDTIKSYTTVVTNDTSSSVCIRKTCDDFVVSCFLHFRRINIKYSLVVCFMIFCKDLMKFFAWLITVSCTSLLSHLNSTVWHKSSLQRFVCLKTNNLLKILCLFTDVSWAICCKTRYYFSFHIKNAALCTLFFLKFLKLTP